MQESPLRRKSFLFAVRVVNMTKYLRSEKSEYVLSKQLLRSGTAIGALFREAEHAESKADYLHKITIALKEANETDYWLQLLKETEYINAKMHDSIGKDCDELIRLLVTAVKTVKSKINR